MLKFFLVAHLTYETTGVSCETKFGLLGFLGHPNIYAAKSLVSNAALRTLTLLIFWPIITIISTNNTINTNKTRKSFSHA